MSCSGLAHGALAILGGDPVPPADLEREPAIGFLGVGSGISGHHRQLAILRRRLVPA